MKSVSIVGSVVGWVAVVGAVAGEFGVVVEVQA
jgi:hypothetical protein